MAGIIIADTIQSGGDLIRLNSASQTVATINAKGIYANTGNLLIAANGTIGVASITNTAITGTITQSQIGNAVATTGPAFSAYLSGNQSLSSTVTTKLAFNSESFDTASCFDTSLYRFTPNVAGYYQINSNIRSSVTSGTLFMTWLYKNGSIICLIDNRPSSAVITNTLSFLVYMNGTTDYLEIYHRIDGTSPSVIGGDTQGCLFSGYLVRAA